MNDDEPIIGQPVERRKTDRLFGLPRRMTPDRRKGVVERRSGTDRRGTEADFAGSPARKRDEKP